MTSSIIRNCTHTLLIIGTTATVWGCQRWGDAQSDNAPSPTPHSDASAPTSAAGEKPTLPAIEISGLASCQPSANLTDALSRTIDVADADGNGEISKDEAYSSADFLVGGFFFSADTNGDGSISPAEGKAARKTLMARYPSLGYLLRQTGGATAVGQSAGSLAELLDIDYAKPVSAAELRSAGHLLVDQVFAHADSDKNGSLTVAEARAASLRGVHALGHAAFQSTDHNHDGKIDLEEFRSALEAPAKVAFELSDQNRDGALTEGEGALAISRLVSHLWLPPSEATSQPPVATSP